jgi:hypothetical protein
MKVAQKALTALDGVPSFVFLHSAETVGEMTATRRTVKKRRVQG